MSTTREAARGNWRMILLHFGLDEKFLRDIHGPCPLCGGTDRYRWDDKEGNGDYYCSQCGPGTGLKLVMELNDWLFDEACKRIDAFLGNHFDGKGKAKVPDKPDKRGAMVAIWKGAREVAEGDPVWRYLTRRCGEFHPEILQDLRFHPQLKHIDGGVHPAMLAGMGWDGKKFSGIHRTYLTLDGQKADVKEAKRALGTVAPIRLGPAMEQMGVAEGIETALCASRQFGIPVWSAVCANGMKAWEPPETAKSIVIFGDNDSNFTGQDAAYALARRLAIKGLQVDVQIPSKTGTDWADSFMGRAA